MRFRFPLFSMTRGICGNFALVNFETHGATVTPRSKLGWSCAPHFVGWSCFTFGLPFGFSWIRKVKARYKIESCSSFDTMASSRGEVWWSYDIGASEISCLRQPNWNFVAKLKRQQEERESVHSGERNKACLRHLFFCRCLRTLNNVRNYSKCYKVIRISNAFACQNLYISEKFTYLMLNWNRNFQ